MSTDDVHPDEMDAPDDFDDAAAHALFSGAGREIDPLLADVVADMRMAFVSNPPVVGAELSALMNGSAPVPAPASPPARRSERMRSILAKAGAATAAVFAATGGLAVAHALPAPMQDAVSHVGIGAPAHHTAHAKVTAATDTTSTTVADPNTSTTVAEPTTEPEDTTVPGDTTTPTTAEPAENHGGAVSDVAHEKGCDHGATVSNVASDGKSHNEAETEADDNGNCAATPTTIPGTTTPTTAKHEDGNDGAGDHGHHDTPPTTVAPGATPASPVQKGDHGNHGGDSGSGSGKQNGNSGSGGNNN